MTPITRSCEIFFLFQIDIMLQRGDFQFCHRTAQRDVYEPWPAFTCQPVIFSRSNSYFVYASKFNDDFSPPRVEIHEDFISSCMDRLKAPYDTISPSNIGPNC